MNDQTPYTTVEAVYNYLDQTPPSESSDEYSEVETYIRAMSAHCDKVANRPLYREEESTILYDGNGDNLLHIQDCIDPTVTVDGVERTVYSYPTTKPYTSRIVLEEGYRFTRGRQNVAVTAVQAMNLYLPDDVQFACTVLVAGILNGKSVQGKVGTTEHIGNYSVTYRDAAQKTDFDTAKKLLQGYRRIAL